jgi:hypothetical protein
LKRVSIAATGRAPISGFTNILGGVEMTKRGRDAAPFAG